MKIRNNLKLRTIAGEAIVLLQADGTSDMTKVIALNASSQYLWEQLVGKDFTIDDVVSLLCGHYDVEETKAREDAKKWLEQLSELKVFE